MDERHAGEMTMARRLTKFALVALATVYGSVCSAQPQQRERFYSPVDMKEIAKIPGVRVLQKSDHQEIDYPTIRAGRDRYDIVENRWEDGSDFRIKRDGKEILKLPDEFSYWGYSRNAELMIYFVDSPRGVPANYYKELKYEYKKISISGQQVGTEMCVYKFQEGDGDKIRSTLRQPLSKKRLDPLPKLISEALSKSEGRKLDDCHPYKAS